VRTSSDTTGTGGSRSKGGARRAIADLYREAGGTHPTDDDLDRFVDDHRVARQARIAIATANRGDLDRPVLGPPAPN
jgi:hypothetical protein